MLVYLLIAAAIFALKSGIIFATKKVSNSVLLLSLVAFHIAFFASGFPLAQLQSHYLAGGAAFIAAIILVAMRAVPGGFSRVFILVFLWVPGWELLFNHVAAILVIMGAISFFIAYVLKHQRVEHYCAFAMAIACGLFMFEAHKVRALDIDSKPPLSAETQAVELDQLRK